jgi:hypothetical protein
VGRKQSCHFQGIATSSVGELYSGFPAYSADPRCLAALRRSHACLYPSVRRGCLSLPRFEAAPPIGFPCALRRARPARIRSERRTDSCLATHAATAASSSVVASEPFSQALDS